MDISEEIARRFDLGFSEHYLEKVETPEFPDFRVGILLGSSGSGKTTILQSMGDISLDQYTNKAICEHFDDAEEAIHYLKSVGLNSTPTWIRTIDTLSMGEQYRAKLALTFAKQRDLYLIDEFTSVLDRVTAKSICFSINKGFTDRKMIFATPNEDVTQWLKADWIYDVENKEFVEQKLNLNVNIRIERGHYSEWQKFKQHHYLADNINRSSIIYLAYVDDKLAGFDAVNNQIGRDTPNSKREHRLVVLPKYQGLGLGSYLSNTIGYLYTKYGWRYFSKTSNVMLGEYRQNRTDWKPTATNLKKRTQAKKQSGFESWNVNVTRLCYSHEYLYEYDQEMEDRLALHGLDLDKKVIER